MIVDAVDHAVVTTASTMKPFKAKFQWLTHPVRARGQGAVKKLDNRSRYLLGHGRFKIIKARRAPWREGMCRCDLVWRVAVEIGRSSGMTRVFLQIRVIPGASPWPSLPLPLLIACRLRP